MSARPLGHLYLRAPFLYYDRRRVYLTGGKSLPLSPVERAVLDCVERGESELGILAHALAELEIGGDPAALAARLLAEYSGPSSLLEIGPPADVIEPEVIVCSFSPLLPHVDSRKLVQLLRRRHRVLHLGLAAHVRGEPRSNVAIDAETPAFASAFQFVQWARSLVRFHTRAVLVLCGTQDHILFADLAATHRSILCLGPDWPAFTSVQDLLGGEALLVDPLAGLQSLFYALRMTSTADYARISHANSSDLAALALYALRSATDVCFSLADQPLELARLGRPAGTFAPGGIAPRTPPRARPRSGVLAVVMDMSSFDRGAPVIAALHRALPAAGLSELVIRTFGPWFDVEVDGALKARPRTRPAPTPDAAVLFPGLARSLPPIVETLCAGTPTVCYPTRAAHPALEEASETWISRATTIEEWSSLLVELVDRSSVLGRSVRAHAERLVRRWDLVGRTERLVRANRGTPPTHVTSSTERREQG